MNDVENNLFVSLETRNILRNQLGDKYEMTEHDGLVAIEKKGVRFMRVVVSMKSVYGAIGIYEVYPLVSVMVYGVKMLKQGDSKFTSEVEHIPLLVKKAFSKTMNLTDTS